MNKQNSDKQTSRHPLFNAIIAKHFFDTYCPSVRNWKHKLRGKDGNNNPIDFTKDDRKAMKASVRKMASDLRSIDLFSN